MKTGIIFSFFGIFLVASISSAQKPRYIKTDYFEGVAFAVIPGLPARAVKNEFMPSVKEIMKLEKKIRDSLGFMASAYEKSASLQYTGGREEIQCNIIENLKKYKRQYTGFIIDGRKVIHIDCYLYPPYNWKEVLLDPTEGARCKEFRVSYDIASGKLYNFFIDFSPI